MKRISLLLLLISGIAFSQNIILSEAQNVHENNDRHLYRIYQDSGLVPLGKIEINGMLNDEVKAFNNFYRKAKITGANAYYVKQKYDLNNEPIDSNPKEILLYYLDKIPVEYNTVYIFGSNKAKKISVHDKDIHLLPYTYFKTAIKPETENYISTKKFLGSGINLYYKKNQPEQYFQIVSGGVRSDRSGVTGGLIIKSGDIITLEKSYAEFLTVFYSRIEE